VGSITAEEPDRGFAFVAPGAAEEGGIGLDSQGGHLLSVEGPLELRERQGEVQLARLELLVIPNSGDNNVKLHLVGIAYEAVWILG